MAFALVDAGGIFTTVTVVDHTLVVVTADFPVSVESIVADTLKCLATVCTSGIGITVMCSSCTLVWSAV